MAKRSRSTIGEDPLDALVPYDESAEDSEDYPTFEARDPDEMSVSAKTRSRTKSKGAKGVASKRRTGQATSNTSARADEKASHVASGTVRDMERMNKELRVCIRELEFELAGGAQEDEDEVNGEAALSEEGGAIISMVKDLHGEIDAAYELKDALEADLAAAKNKLADERAYRVELEARVKLLEAKAVLGEQLREDISFVEEERNETARRLEVASSQLEEITEEHDRLAEQTADDEKRIKQIQNDRLALEAKVLNLEEMVAEMDRLRAELGEAVENSQALEESARGLKGRLEATETSKDALELDLSTTREIVRSHDDQIEDLKEKLAAAHEELTDLRAKLDRQEIENVNLEKAKKRAEREVKTLTSRAESIKKELDRSKKALRDIRSAAARTTGRVRE